MNVFTSPRHEGILGRTLASDKRKISDSTVRRLSLYLRHLEKFEEEGTGTVSSEALARRAGVTAAQVRKDLSLFGSFGKRGLGYAVSELAGEIRRILGLDHRWNVALVGAGRVGSALFEYPGFRERGFHIVAVLDVDPEKVGTRWGDVTIHHVSKLEEVLTRESVSIVILAVPAEAVSELVDRVVDAGVRGILNFAPTQVRVPEGVALNDVNMALELETLSFVLTREGGS